MSSYQPTIYINLFSSFYDIYDLTEVLFISANRKFLLFTPLKIVKYWGKYRQIKKILFGYLRSEMNKKYLFLNDIFIDLNRLFKIMNTNPLAVSKMGHNLWCDIGWVLDRNWFFKWGCLISKYEKYDFAEENILFKILIS